MENKEKVNAEVKQPTGAEQMQIIQRLNQENQQLRQHNSQLFQEYQKVTSVYARLDYLYGVLNSNMCNHFSSDFIVECAEEVENLIRAFRMKEIKEEKEPSLDLKVREKEKEE